jgi:hypothetical protein
MSKFGNLALNTATPSRMVILHPATGKPIIAASGETAYLDLLPLDSEAGRQLAKTKAAEQLKQVAQTGESPADPDPATEQIETLSVLTAGWLLVDPVTREAIDFPFGGPKTACELFGAPEMAWLRRKAYLHVLNLGNFMPALPAS